MQIMRGLAMVLCLVLTSNTEMQAQTKERTIARLLWQDASDQSLKTGDLKRGQGWTLQAANVEGFPTLDAEQQSHVQMQLQDGIVLTGVRDTQDGELQSGWVAIDAGVTKETHGDHFHWRFSGSPQVIATRLDDQQGNPAHVYLYDGAFYLANDKKNGFTVVEPSQLQVNRGASADRFISAGGGHITLAAVGGQVAYATWIDRDGENVGRVDVVRLDSSRAPGYRFQLPSGGIHGATTCSGKIFFAPSDGICWVFADTSVSKQADSVVVNHLTLGEDADGTPLRTGSFRVAGNHVLFNTGRGSTSQLCIVDASSPKPTVLKMVLRRN
ncbi:MAG: hypothetical protein NXI32_21485 [bacterium]|nr:hypothetical protein [bacterium]